MNRGIRPIKPQIHIFFPEASNRGTKVDICEYFFIKHSFQRKVTKAKIVPYPESWGVDFKKAIKEKNKRNSTTSNDKFFIVLDTDIKPNRVDVATVISQIRSLNKKYGNDAKIILSGRSFEVWLCMYDRQQYTTPYHSQDQLNKDVSPSYKKKETWYIQNATRLYDQYPTARNASILSKQLVYSSTEHSTPDGFDLVNDIPDFSYESVLTYLVNTTPFTYMEHLIDSLKQYE